MTAADVTKAEQDIKKMGFTLKNHNWMLEFSDTYKIVVVDEYDNEVLELDLSSTEYCCGMYEVGNFHMWPGYTTALLRRVLRLIFDTVKNNAGILIFNCQEYEVNSIKIEDILKTKRNRKVINWHNKNSGNNVTTYLFILNNTV